MVSLFTISEEPEAVSDRLPLQVLLPTVQDTGLVSAGQEAGVGGIGFWIEILHLYPLGVCIHSPVPHLVPMPKQVLTGRVPIQSCFGSSQVPYWLGMVAPHWMSAALGQAGAGSQV